MLNYLIVESRPEEAADESHQNNSRAEAGNCTDNEDYDLSDGENLLNQRHATAPLVPAMNNASQPSVHDGHRYAHDSLVSFLSCSKISTCDFPAGHPSCTHLK